MSIYSPPTQNVAIFDTELFKSSDNTITQGEADKRYLRFPVAQGTETLQTVNVNGVATFNNNIVQVGNFNIQQPTLAITATENSLKRTTIATSSASTSTATLTITNASNSIGVYPNLPTGSFNPIVQSNDRGIVATGTATILLTTQQSNYSGIRISSSSTAIGFGGSTSSATNAVICDASGVTIRPSITFPDNKVQNSAFTGGPAGTYTNTNMTIDTNGRISAISSGGLPFTPRFANYADYQSTSSSGAYSQGTKIVCSGSWGNRDYIMIRVTAQANWGDTGSGWQYYAATSGQLIFRPHFAPSGTWASLAPGPNSAIYYPINVQLTPLNAYVGNVGKAVYYTGNINNGNTNYFILGGVNKEIQFGFQSPAITGGWEYTHLIEYIVHSSTGGTVAIEPGSGSNNVLP
jgi:hypothetical protein